MVDFLIAFTFSCGASVMCIVLWCCGRVKSREQYYAEYLEGKKQQIRINASLPPMDIPIPPNSKKRLPNPTTLLGAYKRCNKATGEDYLHSLQLDSRTWSDNTVECGGKYALLLVNIDGQFGVAFGMHSGFRDGLNLWAEPDDLSWAGPVHNVLKWALVEIK
jgi:hypothetical protein